MRFLIVEDDLDSRMLLEVYLTSYGQVDTADNGVQAIHMYCEALDSGNPYELICMDIMMPEMDGHQALTEIRKIERERGIDLSSRARVIMTTALTDNMNAQKAFYEEGCEAYLVKPIKKQALVDWLERLGMAFGNIPKYHNC